MSKFFVRLTSHFYNEIENPLHDTLEDALKYLADKPVSSETIGAIYEVTETEVIKRDTYVCFSKGVWLTEDESQFRKTIDYGILGVRDRFIQFGENKDKWNEWATNHNLSEEYLIK